MPRYPVEKYAHKYGIPVSLANILIGQESGGRAGAVSPKGATGLTQVLPSTAAGMYGISESEAARRLKNPEFALDAGFRYLAKQKKDFGSWRLALAAYNAGPNAVRKHGGIPPYRETQDYVRSILSQFKPGKAPGAGAGRMPSAEVSSNGMDTSQALPPAPDFIGAAKLEGLDALRTGQYDPTEQLQGMIAATRQAAEATVPLTPSLEAPQEATGGRLARPRSRVVRGAIAELFHDPLGGIKHGKDIGPIGGHGKHLHFATENRRVMNAVIAKAKRMGLRIGEEGVHDVVDPVHTEGSYHYRRYQQRRNQRKAADISGDLERLAELYRWIERRYR